jgi:hypothetical protein
LWGPCGWPSALTEDACSCLILILPAGQGVPCHARLPMLALCMPTLCVPTLCVPLALCVPLRALWLRGVPMVRRRYRMALARALARALAKALADLPEGVPMAVPMAVPMLAAHARGAGGVAPSLGLARA